MAPSTPLPVYYNENDAFCASWLANLISAGHLPHGDIDTRDIRDVTPNDLRPYRQCHFFAGIGGWPLALRLAAIPVDVPLWTGSCPCQPFSQAGRRGGFADERHLWPSWHWLIEQCRPATILGEQVASASDWLRLVRSDLEALDYAVGAMPVEAASAGADHLRDRYWFVGHGYSKGLAQRIGINGIRRKTLDASARQTTKCPSVVADATGTRSFPSTYREVHCGEKSARPRYGELKRCDGAFDLADTNESCASQEREQRSGEFSRISGNQETCFRDVPDSASKQVGTTGQPRECERVEWAIGADGKARRVKPGVRLLVDGFPNRVGLLRGFGNAIDPRPAQAFIEAAFEAIDAAAR